MIASKLRDYLSPKKDDNSKSKNGWCLAETTAAEWVSMSTSGSGSQTFSNEFQSERNVSVSGDRIKYLISNTRIDEAIYEDKATVNDINSEIESQQIAADDAMQLGELFSIGATVWKVIDRESTLLSQSPVMARIKLSSLNALIHQKRGSQGLALLTSRKLLSPVKVL